MLWYSAICSIWWSMIDKWRAKMTYCLTPKTKITSMCHWKLYLSNREMQTTEKIESLCWVPTQILIDSPSNGLFGGLLTCRFWQKKYPYLFRELLHLPLTMESLHGAIRSWGQLWLPFTIHFNLHFLPSCPKFSLAPQFTWEGIALLPLQVIDALFSNLIATHQL